MKIIYDPHTDSPTIPLTHVPVKEHNEIDTLKKWIMEVI